MTTFYQVHWDNGHACGTLPGVFETEEAAEARGRDWQIEMVASTPGATDDDYTFEVKSFSTGFYIWALTRELDDTP